ncbi:hypothetical protein ACFZDG_03015 [Kitasatospora xanthocidica]|uniref:hypothetical protein n=1 Tax=Kitasatospora xanthocidica TaxID=83382 RepID=UPI0036EDC5B8
MMAERGTPKTPPDMRDATPARAVRPPSKPASAALIRACQADYQKARAEELRRPASPFKYAPLCWEGSAFRGSP